MIKPKDYCQTNLLWTINLKWFKNHSLLTYSAYKVLTVNALCIRTLQIAVSRRDDFRINHITVVVPTLVAISFIDFYH